MAQARGLGILRPNGDQKIKAKHADGTQRPNVRLQPSVREPYGPEVKGSWWSEVRSVTRHQPFISRFLRQVASILLPAGQGAACHVADQGMGVGGGIGLTGTGLGEGRV